MKKEKVLAVKSRCAGFDERLSDLREACLATEVLIFGELANSPLRAVVKPDMKLFKVPLEEFSAVFGFDCIKLAKILTTSTKLLRDSGAVQDAAQWLNGATSKMPPSLQNPNGLVAIHRAAESSDTNFFISLGEHLRNRRNKISDKESDEKLFGLKWELVVWWQPNPRMNWPGLAYCKDSARWDFLEISLQQIGMRNRGKNYLSNLAEDLGLASSPRNDRFVACVKLKGKHLQVS